MIFFISSGRVRLFPFVFALITSPLSAGEIVPPHQWNGSTPVAEVLRFLGEELPPHHIEPTDDRVLAGRRLVHQGQIREPGGAATPLLSHYFKCADCHNSVREDPDLSRIGDPDAKLKFAIENDIPLLQGTTFAGIVNRESWYNDDYARKYRFSLGVQAARNSLKKAIVLCCTQCSQGRKPEDWEMESLLAYFWSLQWKLSDLNVTGEELASWKRTALLGRDREELVNTIKGRYPTKSPATFGSLPDDSKAGYSVETDPDPDIGKQVFTASCLSCHDPAEGAAETFFRDDEKTRSQLSRRFKASGKSSLYHYLRVGTEAGEEQRLYMPNFPRERLSDFQIESLRAYLNE